MTVFTNGAFDIAPDMAEKLTSLGIRLESRPIAALEVDGQTLKGVTFGDGEVRPCDALFAHPPQHQVPLVASLGLDYDADGFVKTDPMMRETSRPGIFAAGDLTTRGQGAVLAASAGAMAGSVVVFDLMKELADGSNARS